MKNKLLILASTAALSVSAHSATLLATGFDGTTLNATTGMSGITYTTSTGITGPTTLDVTPSIFTTAVAAGHFVPNVNVGAGGQWVLVFNMTVGASNLQIDEVVWDRQGFNVVGAINESTGKVYPMAVNLTGTVSGNLGTVTIPDNSSVVDKTTEFAFDDEVQAGETLTMTLTVGPSTSGGGIYVGMDGFSLNGSVIPEPSSALLGGIGILALLRRRR